MVWAGRIGGGEGTALALPPPLMQLCLFRQTIQMISLYICVWLSHSLCLGLEANGQQNSGLVNFAREFHKSVPVTQQAAQALTDWIKKWNLNSLLI